MKALEIKVGALIVVSLGLLVGFVALLGGLQLSPTYRVFVDYDFSGNIHSGAPVKISGIKVGKVDDVLFLGGELDPDTRVSEGSSLTRGSRHVIASSTCPTDAYMSASERRITGVYTLVGLLVTKAICRTATWPVSWRSGAPNTPGCRLHWPAAGGRPTERGSTACWATRQVCTIWVRTSAPGCTSVKWTTSAGRNGPARQRTSSGAAATAACT